jgi:hypothetical protein
MSTRNIAPDHWRDELDSFTRQHEGWLVSITTRGPDGRTAVEARNMPLQGVSPAAPDSNDIAIVVGDRENHLTHEVHNPSALRIELTDDRAERALLIDSKDGGTTIVEFRSTMRPEDVDGLPFPASTA